MSLFSSIAWQVVRLPRCAVCREPLAIEAGEKPRLCPNCQKIWPKLRVAACPICQKSYYDCFTPHGNMGKAGVDLHVKLVPYNRGGKGNPVGVLIRSLKRQKNEGSTRFLAFELARSIRRAAEGAGGEPLTSEQTLITYLPRKTETLVRLGVDQAKELALSLSKEMALPMVSLFHRRRGSVSEKRLTAKEREAALRRMLELCESPKGKTVIVVDDVVTTGALMGAAAGLLKKAGASRVIAASLAVTEKAPKSKFVRH